MTEGHDHTSRGHVHGPARYDAAFAIGTALNLGFVAVEAWFGLRANSMALVADAGHNLSDVLGLLLAWAAAGLARRVPTPRRTYGFRRTSVLAALVNAIVLLVAVGAIAWEAVRRLRHPEPVASGTMIVVALVGILINSGTALLFWRGRQRDLNIRGAFLHMAADAGVSAGVVIAGLVVRATGWLWIDPVTSLLIVATVIVSTWSLLRESVNLALDAVPEGIDPRDVEGYLGRLPGVAEVHDLHIWAMSTTEVALTAHLVRPDGPAEDHFLGEVCRALHDRYGIEHATLQVERGDRAHPCRLAPAEVV
jgi:cobalt-zinc-cadmium efflux system protein